MEHRRSTVVVRARVGVIVVCFMHERVDLLLDRFDDSVHISVRTDNLANFVHHWLGDGVHVRVCMVQ